MSSYRFRRDRKYKRRRALVTAIAVLSVIAIGMAGYLYLNKDKAADAAQNNDSASASTAAQSSQAVSTDTQTPADTTAAATPSADPKGIQTTDHGFLPKVDSISDSGKMDELKKIIVDYTSRLSGKYGVTFIDLATGETVEVNDKTEYIAASTSKLPVNVLLYENVEAGKINLDDMLTYQKEDLEYGTGIIQNSAFGTQYSVRETSKLAMRKSDNCGVNMLIRLVGLENVRSYIDEVGGQVHYGERHRSCPYDMAMIAKRLYENYLRDQDVYGELLNNMENSDWSDRIDAKLPDTVKVAHKIGNQTKTANDVGIVFASHPYVLSVMTDNVDFGTACNNIAELSKKIYDYVESYGAGTSASAQ